MKLSEILEERSQREEDLNSLEGFAAKMKTREDKAKLASMLKTFDKKYGKIGDRVNDIVAVMRKRIDKYGLD